MHNPRILIVAAVASAAVVAVAAAILVGDGSGDRADEQPRPVRSQLTLERYVLPTTGRPELIVSLPDQRLNVLETTRGATSVLLRCADGAGAERIRRHTGWPLLEEPGLAPHIHQPIRPDVLDVIRSCRLTGPGIDFSGRVPGRVPSQ